jgi:hypothetical protein
MSFIDYQTNHNLTINNENSLQKACVKYLRTTDLNFCVLGTEQMLNTDDKRIEAYHLGYQKSICDLIIFTPNLTYNMLCIEFKSPTGMGTLSKEQLLKLNLFEKESRAFTLVCNSVELFVEIITKYTLNAL